MADHDPATPSAILDRAMIRAAESDPPEPGDLIPAAAIRIAVLAELVVLAGAIAAAVMIGRW